MKKLLTILGIILSLAVAIPVYAQVSNPGATNVGSAQLWKLIANKLSPVVSSWHLQLPYISSGQCLHTTTGGEVVGTGSDCGSGGGGSSATTTINGLSAINYTFTGSGITIATSAPGTVTFTSSGGGTGSITTSTPAVIGNYPFWTSASQLSGTSTLIGNGTVAGVNATSSTVSFNVQGNGTLDLFNVASSSGTSQLIITSAGNVGIGTTNPTGVNANSRLTIAGISSQDIIASTTDNTTLSDAILQAYAPQSRVFLGAHGGQQVTTRYGIVLGGWGELGAFNNGSTTNGLIIGVQPAAPLVFGTNNLERMRIAGSGLTSFGTTTPWAKVGIQDDATSTAVTNTYAFDVASSSGASYLMVAHTGRVGIGTTTPGQPLVVVGSTTITSLTAGCVNSTATGGLYTAACASGGSGNSAFTIGNGLIYNATSTDLVGIGTNTPVTTLFIQGKGGTNPFAIASSTGSNMLLFSQKATLGFGSSNSDGGTSNSLMIGSSNTLGAGGNGYFALGGSNFIAGNGAFAGAFGYNNSINGGGGNSPNGNYVFGSSNTLTENGNASMFVFGNTNVVSVSNGSPTAIAFGDNLSSTNGNIMLGSGSDTTHLLTNTISGSIEFSSQTVAPTLFINKGYSTTTSGSLSVGTTTAASLVTIQNIATTTLPILTIASSSGATMITILPNGDIAFGQTTAPSLSCGVGCAFIGTGTDSAGRLRIGTAGVTSGTLTWNKPHATAPICTVNDEQGVGTDVTGSATPTTLIITGIGIISSHNITYICVETQ